MLSSFPPLLHFSDLHVEVTQSRFVEGGLNLDVFCAFTLVIGFDPKSFPRVVPEFLPPQGLVSSRDADIS